MHNLSTGSKATCAIIPLAARPLLSACLLFGFTHGAFGLTNLVNNGSFDSDPWGWYAETTTFQYNPGHIRFSGRIWQDLNTVPGQDYVVRFGWKESLPRMHWDAQVYDTFTNTPAMHSWPHVYRFVRATSTVTRLSFETAGMTALDNVLVGWLLEPTRIIQQPLGRSAFEGGTVSFSVNADGGPPLRYRWFFNDQAITGATNEFLIKNNVAPQDQGAYHVIVSNSANAVTSTVAQLTIDLQPTTPIIVLQPEGATIAAGYGYALRVVALGTAPLQYQWYLNHVPVPGATNTALGFESIQETNQGTFFVVVSNTLGSVQSLPVSVTVYQPTSQESGVGVDTRTSSSPVFDVDGITPIDRNLYTAQLYVGASPMILRPVGLPLSILSVPFRGTIMGSRTVPDVPPGSIAYGQIRVWETKGGSSYEEARARGAKYGFSQVESVMTVPLPSIPYKFPFKSFLLRYGVPSFTTGRLEAGEPGQDGLIQWTLVGEPGFRYLVEKNASQLWSPLVILTNDTGSVTFVDPDQQSSSVSLYRSRILD